MKDITDVFDLGLPDKSATSFIEIRAIRKRPTERSSRFYGEHLHILHEERDRAWGESQKRKYELYNGNIENAQKQLTEQAAQF